MQPTLVHHLQGMDMPRPQQQAGQRSRLTVDQPESSQSPDACRARGMRSPCWSACRREGEDEEGMEEWDQEKLESVVKQKHGAEKPSNQTEIICKYFLEAVEKKQYGWCVTSIPHCVCLVLPGIYACSPTDRVRSDCAAECMTYADHLLVPSSPAILLPSMCASQQRIQHVCNSHACRACSAAAC